jgi:hypothetical protein
MTALSRPVAEVVGLRTNGAHVNAVTLSCVFCGGQHTHPWWTRDRWLPLSAVSCRRCGLPYCDRYARENRGHAHRVSGSRRGGRAVCFETAVRGHRLSVFAPNVCWGRCWSIGQSGKQASEGAVGQGDRVGLADDVAVHSGCLSRCECACPCAESRRSDKGHRAGHRPAGTA